MLTPGPGGPAARGRLRVYLGYAPGAGTTCALLSEGRRSAEHGTDVVVASAETHGRPHTEDLLAALEIIPSAKVPTGARWQSRRISARCWPADPRWALVDGFAHRNAPGSRHRARWQDIEDLLAAGIDVISTVSVGHLDNYSAWSTVTLNERIAALAAEATAILAGCLFWLRLLSAAERLGFSYR